MNPNQNYNNPYDFIMAGGQPPQPNNRQRKVSSDTKKRVLIVSIGAFIVVCIGIIIMQFISNAGKGDINTLYNLAAEQTELIRVADLGLVEARDSKVRNLAATTSVTLKTIRSRTLRIIELRGLKVDPKALNNKTDLRTDGTLSTAKTQNNYDQVFMTQLTGALNKYAASAKAAQGSISPENGAKDVMKTAYDNITTMLVVPETTPAQ